MAAATEWFYTTNKTQMGPVSWDELRELAEVGIVKPHDLVWTEGMGEWAKAINQQGLFADGSEEAAPAGKKKSSYSAPKPPPGRRKSQPEDEEDDDEDDGKEAKKKARKKEEGRAKMAVGVKVGLILAAVVFVLLFLGCAGVGLIWMTVGFGGPAAPKVVPNAPNATIFPTINNLLNLKHVERRYEFRPNQKITITLTNNTPNMNVKLLVFRGNDLNNPLQQVQQADRTCRLEFIPPANDFYVVRVANFDNRPANTINVTIDVR